MTEKTKNFDTRTILSACEKIILKNKYKCRKTFADLPINIVGRSWM